MTHHWMIIVSKYVPKNKGINPTTEEYLVAYLDIFASKKGQNHLIFIIDLINGEARDCPLFHCLQCLKACIQYV